MKPLGNLLLLALLMAGPAAIVRATALPVTNSGFETPTLSSDDTFTSSGMTGWINTSSNPGSIGVERLATSHFAAGQPRAIDGNQVAYTNNGPFTLQQGIQQGGNPVNLTANTVYTLTIYIGDRTDTTFAGYSFGLFTPAGGGTPLVSETDVVAPSNGTWIQRTLTYTATAADPNLGQQLVIRFGNTQALGQTIFDDISLDASPEAVPEPSTMLVPALVCFYLAVQSVRGSRRSS